MNIGKNLLDISFVGAVIKIDGVTITSFMDDQNPVEFQDTDMCNLEWSCNGRMIRTIKPNCIMMSITVIPSSQADQKLQKMLKANYLNGGSINLAEANKSHTASIVLPNNSESNITYNFSNGTFVSGPGGPTAMASGKLGGHTYTFAFEKYD